MATAFFARRGDCMTRDRETAAASHRRCSRWAAASTMWAVASGTACWAGRARIWISRFTASPPSSWKPCWTGWAAVGRWGQAFGVYGLAAGDWISPMPRREAAVGRGPPGLHRGGGPVAGAGESRRRRDFTVNALMEDVLTGQVLDFFGGREDLRRGLLRHVDDHSFPEDPPAGAAGSAVRRPLRLHRGGGDGGPVPHHGSVGPVS